jgi:hypothetical protein
MDTGQHFPHLLSPAHLARADLGVKFALPAHLARVNEDLVWAKRTPNSRLGINMPFQHGKTLLCSVYFPAWVLLLWPETRVVLGSYEENYSGTMGGKVKAVIERWGRPLGVSLRQDTRAKGEWVIGGHEGGMVCKGRHGALTGRPADLLLLDDTIKGPEEALSNTILDGIWDWFSTVAYSRLGPTAPIVNVGTRWVRRDLFGRVEAEMTRTGEPWRIRKFRAIAGANDPLGRKPGEALWPDRVPLGRLQMIQRERGRWFEACWQQAPTDALGSCFQPGNWPTFGDVGQAYSLRSGAGRKLVLKADTIPLIACDWAISERETSDFTALLCGALCPGGELLILDGVVDRFRPEHRAPALALLCRKHRPSIVAAEDDVLSVSMAIECRRHKDIPEPRRLRIGGRAKLPRALPAILLGESGRVYLPESVVPGGVASWGWLESLKEQLTAFSGVQAEHDDQVDCLGILARLCEQLKGYGGRQGDEPTLFIPGVQVI